MARPSNKEREKKATESALLKSLSENGLNEKYYKDQVAEYMKYYDNLQELNGKLTKNLDIEILKEKRQVTKEMRNILSYLGLKPTAEGGGGFEEL